MAVDDIPMHVSRLRSPEHCTTLTDAPAEVELLQPDEAPPVPTILPAHDQRTGEPLMTMGLPASEAGT